jgi:hypothetical protein
VRGKPFFRIHSATASTTLAPTIGTDGSVQHELVGASAFPRHWIYDDTGALVQEAGTIDFKTWYRGSHGERTPWGEEDSPAIVTAAESELERRLSQEIMRAGTAPKRRRLSLGETLVEQGEPGDELYLILDGVLAVEADGEKVAEVGQGRSSASVRCSKVGRGRRPCARRRPVVSPSLRRISSSERRWKSSRRAALSGLAA